MTETLTDRTRWILTNCARNALADADAILAGTAGVDYEKTLASNVRVIVDILADAGIIGSDR